MALPQYSRTPIIRPSIIRNESAAVLLVVPKERRLIHETISGTSIIQLGSFLFNQIK